jgi:5-deoxy-glucuronate isomerase
LKLLYRAAPQPGYATVVSREQTGLKYLEFGLLRLNERDAWEGETGSHEAALVILGGRCDIASGSQQWQGLGQRGDVFEGKATAVYLAPGRSFSVRALEGGVQIGVCKALADAGGLSQVITPEQVKSRTVGAHNWRREVQDIVGADVQAQRLLVGETYNEPGAWSSYPPHKHDVAAPPDEVELEEIYYFRVHPEQGFGIQRIYSADGSLDEVYAIRDGDVVVIPKGYHPVAAAPGYRVYYLWMLAGPQRIMRPRDDPAHAWVHKLEG